MNRFWIKIVVAWLAATMTASAQLNEEALRQGIERVERLLEKQAEREGVRQDPALVKKLQRWDRQEAADPHRSSALVRARYLLYKSTHVLGALAANDSRYQPSVQQLEERLQRYEEKPTDLAGQVSNGFYRVAEMSGVWAASIGVDNAEVELIFERLRYEDKKVPTVHRQMRNGAYRTVEMFLLIARQKTVSADLIDPIVMRLKERDQKTGTIFEQIQNGVARMEEMLDLIVNPPPSAQPVKKKKR